MALLDQMTPENQAESKSNQRPLFSTTWDLLRELFQIVCQASARLQWCRLGSWQCGPTSSHTCRRESMACFPQQWLDIWWYPFSPLGCWESEFCWLADESWSFRNDVSCEHFLASVDHFRAAFVLLLGLPLFIRKISSCTTPSHNLATLHHITSTPSQHTTPPHRYIHTYQDLQESLVEEIDDLSQWIPLSCDHPVQDSWNSGRRWLRLQHSLGRSECNPSRWFHCLVDVSWNVWWWSCGGVQQCCVWVQDGQSIPPKGWVLDTIGWLGIDFLLSPQERDYHLF